MFTYAYNRRFTFTCWPGSGVIPFITGVCLQNIISFAFIEILSGCRVNVLLSLLEDRIIGLVVLALAKEADSVCP